MNDPSFSYRGHIVSVFSIATVIMREKFPP
jgi:hypothetical protein